MAKRRAAGNSDSSDVESYQKSSKASKRARVGQSEDDASPPREHVKNTKEKRSKKKVAVQNEEDDDIELDASVNANFSRITAGRDEEEEAELEAKIQEVMENKPKRKRACGPAQMGVIEKIEMHQFMCHPRLSFKFGPQINFITGHNGSGKSAVLSALTIALGGKAISTGRGNGLKSFIREGQSTAEVSVTIKNQGEEAFKPDVYGEFIIITRRFTKEGSSSYKIKNSGGRIISTRRDELSAICDHMNIQVDNPMNILTQDSARQFLSASHPTDKYQFFLKGTQLMQLQEEYETCLENIGKTSRTLQLKREEIPDLEKAFKEADARNEEATKAREKQDELAMYRRELAWSYVKTKEDELTKKLEETAKARRRLPRIEQSIVEAETTYQATAEKVEALEAERSAVASIASMRNELDDIKRQIASNKEGIRGCKADEKEINQQVGALTGTITRLEEEVKKRTESQGDAQAEHEEAQQRSQAAMSDLETAKQELVAIEDEPATLQRQMSKIQADGKQMESDIARARQDFESATENIQQCKNKGGDDLRLFGNNLQQVLPRIQQEKWFGETPVGPFGLFVAVKDPKWAQIMRIQLGQMMGSFAVTDNRDRYKLKQILDQGGNQMAQIIVSDVDLFDYSRGEPPSDILTVLRALDIKDDFIKRILINNKSIEKIILADTRAIGDRLLANFGGGGLAWTSECYIVRRYAEGGAMSVPMGKLGNQDVRHHMFTGADRSADIKRWEEAKIESEHRLQDLNAKLANARAQFSERQTQHNKIRDQVRTLRSRVMKLESVVVRLQQEAIVEAPVNIDFLEESKAKAMEEKKCMLEQFANVCERRESLDAANLPLIQQRGELERKVENWQAGMREIDDKVTAAGEQRVKAAKDKEHWEKKLAAEKTVVGQLEDDAAKLQTEFQNWSEKAERIGSQVENPRQSDVVERQIKSVEKALQQHERRQGASPEEIAVERDNAKLVLDTHKRQLEELTNLNKVLKSSLASRMGKWVTFRQHISVRCKHQFQHHLWARGYYGKVLLDHITGTLNLKVQTDDQASTQSKDKDPKSLSGGEKSYSTICLLLALWESIQCPIRCLDEFDVFMDSVNRKISMKMMIETAQNSDKQYILITPQDMSSVEIGSNIRVQKMHDPERNQNPLSF